MRSFITLVVGLAVVVVPTAVGRDAVNCSSPGEWPHTRDAEWLARALSRAGYGSFGCTGSAFVVDLGGQLSSGQVYVWATTTTRSPSEPMSHVAAVGRAEVHWNRIRGWWRVRGRTVWVQTASARELLPPRRWAAIVRATLAQTELGLVQATYVGVACPHSNSTVCGRVGIAVWVAPASVVEATLGGVHVRLRPPAQHASYWRGFVRLNLHALGIPSSWYGSQPTKTLTLRLRIHSRFGWRSGKLRVLLHPGWG